MPMIDYDQSGWQPNIDYADIIDRANAICAEYQAQGYDITLRQLYYQFVARGFLPNKQESYDKLGRVCVKARENGFMDWDYLVDRTRNVLVQSHWDTPESILEAVADQFRLDKWANATHVVEVWVEKEALAGVIQAATNNVDTLAFPCRGYVSTSEMYVAAQRIVAHIEDGVEVTVLYLGDYDPSGVDMARDNEARLRQYVSAHVGDERTEDYLHFSRIALTAAQIAQYNPPPAPAKPTDSRHKTYVASTGQNQSWELDALDPATLVALVEAEVVALRDDGVWDQAVEEEKEHKRKLSLVHKRWADVSTFLEESA